MIWLGIFIGLIAGVGGYYLYERFFSSAVALGKELLGRARGDYSAALAHVRKL